jgi:hypothetical protein
VDEIGSGLCPVTGFGVSGVEPMGSATRDLGLCQKSKFVFSYTVLVQIVQYNISLGYY